MQDCSEYYSIWSNNFESYLKQNNLLFIQKLFNSKFEKKFNSIISRYELQMLSQLNGGNRMRPRIVFWTFLLSIFPISPKSILSIKIEVIVNVCVSLELIHKSSLILDDMIDKDKSRKGDQCLHIVSGCEKASLVALNMITHSIYILHNSLDELKIDEINKKKILSLSIHTIDSMSFNAIKDLDFSLNSLFNLNEVKQIVRGEVSTLFVYSFLSGYYLGNGKNKLIEEALINMGETLGFLMQLYNDMEPYKNANMTKNHKSRMHYDFLENQKSIVAGYLGEFLSVKEIEIYKELSIDDQKLEFFNDKMNKYQVWQFINRQIEILKKELQSQNELLITIGVNKIWYKHFNNLINLMVQAAEKRIK